MSAIVHQVFHGYSRGHRRLAATIELLPEDADAVDQLSDLSGMVSTGESVAPYYTAYPLPSGRWYAFARTWLDDEVSRAGCAITQTLLISRQDEQCTKDLNPMVGMFAQDVRNCYLRIKENPEPLAIPHFKSPNLDDAPSRNPRTNAVNPNLTALIHAFFTAQTRPLVMLGTSPDPSDILRFRSLLWDEIRFRFSFCTYALQPISLPKGEFDLLVAPIAAETRFYKCGTPITIAKPGRSSAKWLKAYNSALSQQDNSELSSLYRLGNELACLGSDPTVLPLLADLDRTGEWTPAQEPVTALNVVRRLAPHPKQAQQPKRELIRWALESFARPSAEGITQLQKLTEVLTACETPELATAFRDCRLTAKEAAARALSGNVGGLPHLLSQLRPSKLPHVELEAIAEALSAATQNATMQWREVPEEWKAALLLCSDELLRTLYESEAQQQFTQLVLTSCQHLGPKSSTRLLSSIQNLGTLTGDENLFKLAYGVSDAETAKKLFHALPENASSHVTSAAEAFIEFHPDEAYETAELNLTATRPRRWRLLFALALPLGPDGLSRALDLANGDPADHELVSTYLCRLTTQRVDRGVRQFISRNPDRIVGLIATACQRPDPQLSESLGRLISSTPEIDISSRPEILEYPWFEAQPFSEELLQRSIERVIRLYLKRKTPATSLTTWARSPVGATWLTNQPSPQIKSLLISTAGPRSSAKLLAMVPLLPEAFWQRHSSILFDVVREHADRSPDSDFPALYEHWEEVLQTLARVNDRTTTLKLRFYQLFRALGLPHLPVSPFVVDALPHVHEFLCNPGTAGRQMDDVLSFIPWPTWDKAKYLRKRAVSAFLGSRWPKTDLVLASGSPELLRKLLERLKKTDRGEDFVRDLWRTMSREPRAFEEWQLNTVSDAARGTDAKEEWV